MAIMREQTFTVVLNHETMEIYLGAQTKPAADTADGELDQDVLKRLGYIDDDESSSGSVNIEKEVHRFLPDQLTVKEFDKDWTESDARHENLYMINYYPNGQCDRFNMELQDQRGSGVKLENDPISGKIISEFTQ